MPPDSTVIDCTLQVAAAYDRVQGYTIAGTILGVIFLLAAAIVLFNWTDKRDLERTRELNNLRQQVRDLEAKGTL